MIRQRTSHFIHKCRPNGRDKVEEISKTYGPLGEDLGTFPCTQHKGPTYSNIKAR